MNIPSEIERIAHLFEGSITTNEKQFYKQNQIPVLDDFNNAYQLRMETVGSISIHIPEHRINDFRTVISDIYFENYRLRKSHEAIQKAYDKYLMLISLIKEHHD